MLQAGEADFRKLLQNALDALADAKREDGNGVATPALIANLTAAVHGATSTSGRAKTIKDLAMAAEKLIALERRAFELDDPEKCKPPEPAPDRSISPAEHYKWLCAVRAP